MSGGALDWDEDEPEFPEQDDPVFLPGVRVLTDAVCATVGEDSLSEILGVLLPVPQDALPGVDSLADRRTWIPFRPAQ